MPVVYALMSSLARPTLLPCFRPPPFSQQHNGYLKNYQTTGVAKILGTSREVVAIHRDK